ncbi:MAG: P-loop NTPase fold protein [Minicystis sp.]
MSQPPQIARLSKLSQVFDPLWSVAISGGGFAPSYVEEAHQEFREQLEASLTLSTNAKLLVAGQPGCGKTTLLAKVAQHLRASGRIVAFVNLESVTAVQDMGAMEMHLAAAAELLAIAEKAGLPLSGEVTASIEAGLTALGARPDAGKPFERIHQLLKVARDDPSLRAELRSIARSAPEQDPQALLFRLLRELEDHRPVVILDGLDKLPPERAREFFLDDKTKPMADAPCAAILTIPLSIVYEPTFNVLRERYNNADNPVLPAVRLYEFHGQAKTRYLPGYNILQRIVRTRLAPIGADVMADDAIERAIEASGGNIRELARMIQASIVKTVVRRGDEVELRDMEAAIGDQRESYRRAYQPQFLPVLVQVRDTHKLESRDDVGKLLLYGLWVVEYRNDEAWYGLPAAVEQLVLRLEKAK